MYFLSFVDTLTEVGRRIAAALKRYPQQFEAIAELRSRYAVQAFMDRYISAKKVVEPAKPVLKQVFLVIEYATWALLVICLALSAPPLP